MKKKIKEKTQGLISKTKSAYYLTKDSIRKLGDTTPEPRAVFDLNELYHKGEAVGEEDNLIKALQECFAIESWS